MKLKAGEQVKVVNSPYWSVPNGTVFNIEAVDGEAIIYNHPISGEWVFHADELEAVK